MEARDISKMTNSNSDSDSDYSDSDSDSDVIGDKWGGRHDIR